MAKRKSSEPTPPLADQPFQPLAMPAAPASVPGPAREPPPIPPGLPLDQIPGIDARLPGVFRQTGYGDLWPSQQEAAPIAVAGGNLVLAVPTASGKSLIAYLALLSKALKGTHGIYLVPLRALASEKYEDLKALAAPLGLRVGIAIGDLDAEDPYLARFDIVVATSEKADALFRHKASWLKNMGCIVADEVHLMGDAGRGPTLEVLLARFKQLNPGAQLVALSATIHNSKQIADWLKAAHVRTDWRPVSLREGIFYGKGIQFLDNEKREVKSELEDASLALAEDSIRTGGSTIVFVSTRKSTEALAEKLVQAAKPYLSQADKDALAQAAADLKGANDSTSVESKLAKCIAGGAAFHHAGLRNTQRSLVEKLFKAGHIKALSATPTLAAGVNLPARRVVVRDLFRYDVNSGNMPIPVLEYKQMAGRAGRPRFDKVGEAITIAKSHEQRSEILLSFLLAEPERVESKLGTETALRTHILSSIASGFVQDEQGLDAFMQSTFYAHTSDTWVLKERITKVIDFLLENDLITSQGDELEATKFGKRVSELYIDPASAVKIRGALGRVKSRNVTPLSWLHLVASTPDMIPLYLRKGDEWLEGVVVEHEAELLVESDDHEYLLAHLKTASLLLDWIDEAPEEKMLVKYGAYPGDVANKVDAGRWLLHATEEIARLFEKSVTRDVQRLSARMEFGAKAELLPLLELKGVGRFRARQIFSSGFTSKELLARATLSDLTRIQGIGPIVAASILRELGRADVEEPEAAKPSGQQRLFG